MGNIPNNPCTKNDRDLFISINESKALEQKIDLKKKKPWLATSQLVNCLLENPLLSLLSSVLLEVRWK